MSALLILSDSCTTRNRSHGLQSSLFAERLVEQILAPVAHRHVVFTVPEVVRGLFERERRLLSTLTRCAHVCVQTLLREAVGDPRAVVGTVASS